MASHFSAPTRAAPRAAVIPPPKTKRTLPLAIEPPEQLKLTGRGRVRIAQKLRIRVSNGDNSYLDMWSNAVDREKKTVEFQKMVENSAEIDDDELEEESPEVIERRTNEFQKILEVPAEERDRVQRMQVIDRAAAAISAARALLSEYSSSVTVFLGEQEAEVAGDSGDQQQQGEMQSRSSFLSQSGTIQNVTPGPDFWSWTPPEGDTSSKDGSNLNPAAKTSFNPAETNPVMEKERPKDFLSIPFESKLVESNQNPFLPPLQSLMEVEKVEISNSGPETTYLEEKRELGVLFSENAAEASHALHEVNEAVKEGVNADGTMWWKERGIEQRADGVLCRWALTRGVSADKAVEWEDKYWEASDPFGYKELGSEKSGRDVAGNVWREFWRESMWQEHGLVQFEKTADKWGKNGTGDEWQEKWWERYDASGQAEKWAHKWCSIDPQTYLEAGHAHVWHERWGETYDGQGGSMKYTDKWAERSEGEGWTKWGDKWDEHFDPNGHGVKQGETWWQGKHGERWNRTWGEGHNGSGWVHKYGKSSSGEHWDTHEEQETWYERYPHFGFQHCFDNSVQLREVQPPPETS